MLVAAPALASDAPALASDAPALPSKPPRNRSIDARRAARAAKARREQRIMAFLVKGVSVAELAGREGLSERRRRAIVQDILSRRMPEPPAEFLALQVARLNEARSSPMARWGTETSRRSNASSGSCASSTAIMGSPPRSRRAPTAGARPFGLCRRRPPRRRAPPRRRGVSPPQARGTRALRSGWKRRRKRLNTFSSRLEMMSCRQPREARTSRR